MHDALAMRFVERVADLDCQFENLVSGKRSTPYSVREGFTFEQFHHEEVDPLVLPDIEQRTDVWMAECRNDPRLALKALTHLRIRRKISR